MATVVKIRGLERGKSAVADASTTGGSYRGFKVPSALGPSVTGGTSARSKLDVGTSTNGIRYTSKIGGAKGDNITITQSAASGSASVAVTYAATTGYPTITVVPKTGDTINQLVAVVNADPAASQLVTASALTDGTGTSPATGNTTLTGGSNGTGTSEPFFQIVNSKTTVMVDLDDQKAVKHLRRNANRWISLGAA